MLRQALALIQASTLIAFAGGWGIAADDVHASTPVRADIPQSTTQDPCRFATAEAVGTAFGRAMKSSRLGNACQYRGAEPGIVVVKVDSGTEGTIFKSAKSVVSRGLKGAEKVATPVGEAYVDGDVPAFVGRVGTYNVQIETTIDPLPRAAMIAVGTKILQSLAGK